MSKFLPQKRKLLEDVYEKASNATTETSFSGILKSLERDLLDDFKISLSYRSFETYYKTIVENDNDYNIKPAILNDLSLYLGYDSFREYCLDWKTIEYTVSQTLSKIVINITNKPIFTMPDFLKQNGLGIFELLFVVLMVTGGIVFSGGKKNIQNKLPSNTWNVFGGNLDIDKKYMYWNGERYIGTDSSYISPGIDIVAMDSHKLLHFKKIMRKDTLTNVNSLGKTWYSKYNNEVEFFTDDGIDPDNGRELRKTTSLIIDKYAGKQKDSVEFEE